MYADRVDAAAKTSIKDRLNGNSIGDSARLRHITGKRQRQDDKWEHDLYDDGGPRVSNHKIDARDLRLKLQRKSFQQASPRSGVQDLREKLSGTMNSQPANVIFVEGDSNALIMPAKKSNKRKGMNQEQEVAKKNKNPQLSKSQKRKLKKLEGKLNETSTVDLGKASNFLDFPLLRPPTTPTVVHVSRPDEFLYEAGYGSNHSVVRNGVIGVTQPRRIAVLATARRVAFELGLHLGKEVGFQVRHDKRIGDNCSIKFMTDGILLREVQVWIQPIYMHLICGCFEEWILSGIVCYVMYGASSAGGTNTDMDPCKKDIVWRKWISMLMLTLLLLFNTFFMLQTDILLKRYSVIILDEAHERSVNTDILIGMLSRVIQLRQKKYEQQQKMVLSGQSLSPENMIFPLKLVLMSATLRVEDFISERRLFHDPPPVINVPTRQFEVTAHFSKRTETVDYIGQAYKQVMSIHKRLPQGGILVFVTGQREVEYLCQKLRKASTELIANTAKGRVGDEVPAMSEMVSIEGVDMKDIDEAFEIQGNLIDQQTERFGSHDEDVPDSVENESDVSYDSGSESEVEIVGDEVDIEDAKTSENDVVGVLREKSSLVALKSAFEALAGENASECKSEGKQIPSMPEESPEQYKNSMEKKTVGDKGLFTSALRVMPLYAMLPAVAQLHVFDEVKEGERLVVVATNVAETSLTIPGIKYVVDTGREKVKNYNSSNGMEAYEVQWISKASADQRKGRAGRTGPGHCYRLYSSAVYNNILPDFSCAEISKVPVDSIVLVLKSMHIDKVEKFPFPTPPEAAALVEAERCLKTLEALDNTGRLTSLGKAMACYPMSPRHSRMLLTAIQITRKMKDHDTANLVLGYAVATAAALSFSNAFLKHFEGSHTDSNGSEQDGRSSSLGSNKILDKQEKIKKKKLRETTKLSRARFSNSTSDTLTVAYALHCFELSTSPVGFCHENGLHLKTMEEMSKLRRQLLQLVFNHHVHELEQGFSWTHGTVEDVEQAWRVLSSKRSTLLNVEDILGQAICAGWVDRVAKRIRGNSGSLEGDRKASAVRYQACMVKETVFLHRRSSLSNSAPEFLVYSELLHTKRPYMHGATSIKPEWLAKYGVSLCSFSTVEDRKPEYDPQTDQLYRWVIPTFGPHLWRLPAQSMPISSDEDRLKVCAKFPELIHSLKQIKRGVKDQKLKG
ncbi:ATP-dependent RNA helicase DEAH13-like isoform X1 [Populus alba x Populus x berolinensis]|uniref:RNA helicase n=1 Tax=Populus alba x Populus x berolinensis TaxID=444605 RepID=A0AAD6RIT9_9ROSI|nr:ATP-dependent RNA helicase DEAH13-like isoform X1 [Populus alba x Populus x berolinensis]